MNRKDEKFLNEKTEKLNPKIEVLLDQGLTKEEIADYNGLHSKLESLELKCPQKIANDIRTKQQFKKGASWNGNVLAIGVVAGMTVLVVAWFVR